MIQEVEIEKPAEINFILGQTHFIKSVEDLYEAMVWAKSLLTRHEGDGHLINVTSSPYTDNQVTCCFAKPESIAEHCGEYMDTASEAVVAAVLEYLNGE